MAVQGAEGEVFNVASGKPVSIRAMIEKVCALIGSGKPQHGEVPYRPGENMALYANVEKAEKYLQWKPQSKLDQGLQETIDWYKNNKA